MQGTKLDYGCSKEDYRIKVGVDNCTVTDFTSNQMSCEAPLYRPTANVTWLPFCGNSSSLVAVVVSIFIVVIIIIIIITSLQL